MEYVPARVARVLPAHSKVGNPVPIPNLTKKSRGRHVPTTPFVLQNGISKNIRLHTCTVEGCGKCFARGEHLKRHIRSIHTNDKPYKCMVSGCGKSFSRHDNLNQHTRIHKNYSAPKDGGF
ncbi:hypothetical protein EXIGLDRAFT_612657 [Exidia glandulosa HHB12029]|uniref:C2H2-type domain-containing protein n=1 Tax=Exidia glandulosa HHB12029 TaxID=1314781 RepID=A0A165IQE6_EXIGL|nr:hypothetical protein EXIGLDRAFT_612657 [Exidia glandulosa HHB12029]